MLLHSRQKRNVICSWGSLLLLLVLVEGGERAAGEDMVGMKWEILRVWGDLFDGLESLVVLNGLCV